MVEMYTKYFCAAITKIQKEDIKKMQVTKRAGDDFKNYADTYLKRTTWTGPCSSWFKNGEVDNKPALWPGSRVQCKRPGESYTLQLTTHRHDGNFKPEVGRL